MQKLQGSKKRLTFIEFFTILLVSQKELFPDKGNDEEEYTLTAVREKNRLV